MLKKEVKICRLIIKREWVLFNSKRGSFSLRTDKCFSFNVWISELAGYLRTEQTLTSVILVRIYLTKGTKAVCIFCDIFKILTCGSINKNENMKNIENN